MTICGKDSPSSKLFLPSNMLTDICISYMLLLQGKLGYFFFFSILSVTPLEGSRDPINRGRGVEKSTSSLSNSQKKGSSLVAKPDTEKHPFC